MEPKHVENSVHIIARLCAFKQQAAQFKTQTGSCAEL